MRWRAILLLPLSAVLTAALCAALAAGQSAPRPDVDAIFAPWDRADSPGCALGVVRDGELIYERGYGIANLDWHIPIATDTVFYVGSVSKQFTAAAVALLVLDGRVALDDDIREYFPEIPAYERPITVAQLLHHTSGIRDIYTLMALAGIRLEDVFSDEEAIALIAAQRETNFPPGDEYLYSNSGYFLLAQLVARVTGKPLRAFAAERIFTPLGMSDTHFHDIPSHVVERRATSYQRDADEGFTVSYLGNFDKVGAGGLYSTVRDLLLWDRNFYTGDVGGQAFLDLIQTPGTLYGGEPITYAFGLTIDHYRGLATVSHSGSMMGFKAAFLQFPEQRFSVLATCNLGEIEPMGLAQRVADIYLDDELEREPPADARRDTGAPRRAVAETPFDAAELAAYAGDFYSAELDVTYHLHAEGDELWLSLRNTPPRRFRKVDGDFRAGGWTFRFERAGDGAVEGFTVDAGRVTNIRFERR
ncbi:MAG: serine hydrolase domain-containing protein [Acidobacteriota bacterium]